MFDKRIVAWLPTVEVCLAGEAGDVVETIGRRPEIESSLSELETGSANVGVFNFDNQAYLFCREEGVRPCHRVPSGSLLHRRRAPFREMMLGDEAFDSSSKRAGAFWRHCNCVDADCRARARDGGRLLGLGESGGSRCMGVNSDSHISLRGLSGAFTPQSQLNTKSSTLSHAHFVCNYPTAASAMP